jgi:predicted enzyme related to lactoylglutathione lyase
MKKLIEWVEIPTADFSRAVNFYNKVFMLSLQEIDCGSEKMACFPTGEGAIFYKPDYKPSTNGVIVSFCVPDCIPNKNRTTIANNLLNLRESIIIYLS